MNTLWQLLGARSAEYNRWELAIDPALSTPLTAVLLAILAGSLYWYVRGLRVLPPRRRRLLTGLRVAALALIALSLLQLGITLQHVQRTPVRVTVAQDRSASMALHAPGQPPRDERLKEYFNEHEAEWATLRDSVRLSRVHFAGEVQPVEEEGWLPDEAPNGERTDLWNLLDRLAHGSGGEPPQAVILFSDGADTERLSRMQEDGTLSQSQFAALGFPVYTVGLESVAPLDDLALTDLRYDEFAFTQNPIEVEVNVRREGLEGLHAAQIQFYQEESLIDAQTVAFDEGAPNVPVTFKFTPRQTGEFLYRIVLDTPQGDAVPQNNELLFAMKIIRDKIRVLQVTGRPSWDVRFLRRLLKRNPNVELIAFYILRTPNDPNMVPNTELSLIPFPRDELFNQELDSFDLVIFHNFDYQPSVRYQPYVPAAYLENVETYVANGGAFAMVGGDLSFGEGGYDRTALDRLLPVQVTVREGFDVGELSLRITDAGVQHPVTRLGTDETEMRRRLGDLPRISGLNRVAGLAPGGVSLLEARTTSDGDWRPLMAIREFGKGRTLALTTDDLWRWHFHEMGLGSGERTYTDLWNRAIRWLVRDPFLERVRITTTKSNYHPGESIEGTVLVLGSDFKRAEGEEVVVEVTRETAAAGGEPQVEYINGFTDAQGELPFSFVPQEPGGYRLRAFLPGAMARGQTLEAFTVVTYLPAVKERQRVRPNPQLLQAIATGSGGAYSPLDAFRLQNIDVLGEREAVVDRQETLSAWDNGPMLGAIVVLLSLGWWLRRRWGLA